MPFGRGLTSIPATWLGATEQDATIQWPLIGCSGQWSCRTSCAGRPLSHLCIDLAGAQYVSQQGCGPCPKIGCGPCPKICPRPSDLNCSTALWPDDIAAGQHCATCSTVCPLNPKLPIVMSDWMSLLFSIRCKHLAEHQCTVANTWSIDARQIDAWEQLMSKHIHH